MLLNEDWKKLSEQDKDFYKKLSYAQNLTREFEHTQKISKGRIEQIKNDSKPFFNDESVIKAVKNFKKDVLENSSNFNLLAEPFTVLKKSSSNSDLKPGSKSIPSNEEFKLETSSGGPQGSLSSNSQNSPKDSTSESSKERKLLEIRFKDFGTNTEETYIEMVDKSHSRKLLYQV
jgi:hypothetical protein